MTPRAWRMIAYSCVGALIYGLILLAELLQNVQMSKIDAQLQQMERQDYEQTEPATPSGEPPDE